MRLLLEARMIEQILAQELAVSSSMVAAAVKLLDEGCTVPFIARYRKEATGGLDDTQLRTLEERLRYLRELEDRRSVILASVGEQDKLTPDLEKAITSAKTKTELEDLYLPYKPKRRTKGEIAKEAGIEPLANRLYQDPNQDPETLATQFLNPEKGFGDVRAVLDGARYILMERFAEDAGLIGKMRKYLAQTGAVTSKVVEGKEQEGIKFSDYFAYDEPLSKMAPHRFLALLRGQNLGFLQLNLVEGDTDQACGLIGQHVRIQNRNRPADSWLDKVVRGTWSIKIKPHLETDLMSELRGHAETASIRVFATNLKDLLLAPPAGKKVTMGLDPGIRTGVKLAIVDATGKLLQTSTLYPHAPQHQWQQGQDQLARFCKQFGVELISIGNGTASRETEKWVADMLQDHPDIRAQKVVVSEAGASVYSASALAAAEFPELDVSLRGAVSIARRLQDPLAELVKIEPKAIGVGQYQHDVNQTDLNRSLDAVVEDCVNAVGVEVNTASAPLLSRVSGLNKTTAQNIVAFRDENGPFKERKNLTKVPRLGAKAFEQAAGFLRIQGGKNPLDASGVHPESYPVVERVLKVVGRPITQVMGNADLIKQLNPRDFTDGQFGLPTVQDIFLELAKPGRDPRPEFKTAQFKEGLESMDQLQPGMVLEGVVTNVTHFGAFVDVGVHQDGLVHISHLADRFVKDPREVVKAGQIVKVTVLEVDLKRKRVSLSMKKNP
ncbi:MAG: RNA-binding transcriptional accessory protein [Acidobacteria bacterium]|nr:RNA-binding transcriptional accessory protein [Acidobacteriota bacterium]